MTDPVCPQKYAPFLCHDNKQTWTKTQHSSNKIDMIDNEYVVHLDASQLKLEHVARGRFDKHSRKQLCTGFHLMSVQR